MKKTVLLLVMCCMTFGLSAQRCTPDTTIKDPGIYPNYLDTGTVGLPYEHTLQILAIRDTQVIFSGIPINAKVDSIVLNEIIGLPASFNYGCEPNSCTFTYQAVGCASITGSPNAAEQGVHPLGIVVTSYAMYSGIPLSVTDTLTEFVLVIEDSAVNAIDELEARRVQLSPNPSINGLLNIQSEQPVQQLWVADHNGREMTRIVVENQRFVEVDLHALARGLYVIHVQTSSGLIRLRWIRL